eukprot:scaffold15661_cov134-Isochrysis_galbana.AAC.1
MRLARSTCSCPPRPRRPSAVSSWPARRRLRWPGPARCASSWRARRRRRRAPDAGGGGGRGRRGSGPDLIWDDDGVTRGGRGLLDVLSWR